jgi:hypothetical protein
MVRHPRPGVPERALPRSCADIETFPPIRNVLLILLVDRYPGDPFVIANRIEPTALEGRAASRSSRTLFRDGK